MPFVLQQNLGKNYKQMMHPNPKSCIEMMQILQTEKYQIHILLPTKNELKSMLFHMYTMYRHLFTPRI